MAKAPLKQLSVNTFESQRIIPTKKCSSIHIDGVTIKKKPIVSKQSEAVEEKSLDIPSIVRQGARMSTNEFETFVQKAAPNDYWHIMAEFYRAKLEDVTHENQQLHEIVDQLNKDNDNLRAVADHCEYLTDIIEKLTGDSIEDTNKKSSVCVRLF